MEDLNEVAERIAVQLRANGFEPDGGIRQALDMIEECGEMTGAYRRWTGRARRSGTREEFCEELADVVITAYVTAAELFERLDVTPVRFHYENPDPAAAWPIVLVINHAVAVFVSYWQEVSPREAVDKLADVVMRCFHLAGCLGIDLDEAVQSKLEKVFSRGWRELAKDARVPGVAILPDPNRAALQAQADA